MSDVVTGGIFNSMISIYCKRINRVLGEKIMKRMSLGVLYLRVKFISMVVRIPHSILAVSPNLIT